MDVDVKVVRTYLWRFSVWFAGICFRFAQMHPCISGTLLSLLVLYFFFPLLFRLLIYSSPIMVWVYAHLKNVIKYEQPEARIEKKDDQMNDAKSLWVKIDGNVLAKKRYVNLSLQNGRIHAPVLQHKALGTQLNTEVSKDDQGDEDANLKKAVTKSESDILGKTENDLKVAEGESESDIFSKGACGEEETQGKNVTEETQNTVQQTAEDETLLMDFGTSEIERDRRLEGLIQKRRARKLLSMQVRNVIDIIGHPQNQIAPLVIARGAGPHNLINTLSDTDDLHMPGSAPSLLLPTSRPFDLPYDPFEERPDVTGDSSFQQEFITSEQKDIYGHDAFSLGPGQARNSLNALVNQENKAMKRHRFSRFRSYRDRGSYDTLSPGASSGEYCLLSHYDIAIHNSRYEEQSSNQPLKPDNATTIDKAKSEDSRASVNSNAENKEKCGPESPNAQNCLRNETDGPVEVDPINSDYKVDGAKADSIKNLSSEELSSYLHKSLVSSLQENGHAAPVYISSKDLFNVHKRVLHTPAYSIASDLVVEISEAGSPPPTLSPPDGDSSQCNVDAVDRDLSSGSEGMSMEAHPGGTNGSAEGESVPEAVMLEQDVVDENEHANQTSSDDDLSHENVARHLIEKLKARCRNKGTPAFCQVPNETTEMSLSGTASAGSTAIASEKHFELVTCLDRGTSGCRGTGEPDKDSSKRYDWSVEEDVHGRHEMGSSGDVALPNVQQAQASEELQTATSPQSVLPSTYSRDEISTLETQPSDLRSSPSETTKQVTESEATLNSFTSDYQNVEASATYILLENQADSLVGAALSDSFNADVSNGLTEKSPNLNASSTTESSQQNVVDDTENSGESTATSVSGINATERDLEHRPEEYAEPPA